MASSAGVPTTAEYHALPAMVTTSMMAIMTTWTGQPATTLFRAQSRKRARLRTAVGNITSCTSWKARLPVGHSLTQRPQPMAVGYIDLALVFAQLHDWDAHVADLQAGAGVVVDAVKSDPV